jgi:hypothetical protein
MTISLTDPFTISLTDPFMTPLEIEMLTDYGAALD